MSLAEPVLWLVEAGAGFGKTVLLEQLRSACELPAVVTRGPMGEAALADFTVELAGAARRAGLDEVEAAIAAADGDAVAIARALAFADCCLLIDHADAWGDDVVALLIDVLYEIADRMPCVLTGRSLVLFQGLRQRPQTRAIAGSDMAFSTAEVDELVLSHNGDEAAAGLIHTAAQGWPLAVASLAARVAGTAGPAVLENLAIEHENLIDGLLRSYLENLNEADIEAAVEVASLPFFDEGISDMAGTTGLVQRLMAAGVPITRRADGWLELAEQFRQSLLQRRTDVPVNRAVLDHYVERGEINAAIGVCLATGSYQEAAELIAGLTNDQQTRLEPSTLNAAIATLGDAVTHAPRCLLVQTQVNGTFGRITEGLRAIERAEEAFAQNDPNLELDAHLEALLELGLWRCFDGHIDTAWSHLERVAGQLGADSRVDLRARTHDLRGLLLHFGGTEESLEQSAVEMTEALRLWRSIAEPRPAAATVFRLAGGVLADLGQRGAALDILENLPSVGPMTLVNRARLGLERSALLPFMGRASEVPAVVTEVRRLASLLGHEWIVAWSYWTEMVACSVTGHGSQLGGLLQEFDDKAVRIGDDQTDANMWCDVAEAFARCGLHNAANEMLARARALHIESMWVLDYAEASVEARCGEPDRALSLVEALDLVSEVEHERRWRIEVVRAIAHLRSGSGEDANKFLDRAFELASELGQPRLPHFMEAAVVRQIRSGEVEPAVALTAEVPLSNSITITLFDEFRVVVSGVPVDLPRGQVSDLVKLLVLGDGSLIVDQVIDQLWPDASLDVGRRRLRNLLGRLRESCPDLVERGDDRLRLGHDVSSDLATSQQAAFDALADPTADTLGDAIALNRGELLPSDRYEDWAEQARQEQLNLLVRLLDARGALAEQVGDVDGTVSALMEAHRLSPGGSRKRTAAEVLKSAGRDVAAAALSDGDD